MAELAEYGYWGLFLAAFVAATVIPFSSEAVLSAMVLGDFDAAVCVAVASVGNFLGGMTNYYLGFLGRWQWIEKYMGVKQEKVFGFKNRVDRYGPFFALLCWTPVIGDPIAIALGFFRTRVAPVAVYMFIGKFLRYAMVAYAMVKGMEWWQWGV